MKPSFLSFLIISIFLFLLFSPVSATTRINLTNDDEGYTVKEISLNDDAGSAANISTIYFRDIGMYSNLRNINFQFVSDNYASWSGVNVSSQTVYGYIGTDLISTGTLGWNRATWGGGGTFYYDIVFWNASNYDGEQCVNLSMYQSDSGAAAFSNSQSALFPIPYLNAKWDEIDQNFVGSDDYAAGFSYGQDAYNDVIDGVDVGVDYYLSIQKFWQNDIDIDYSGNYAMVDIYRYIDDRERWFWSDVEVNKSVNGVNFTIYHDKGSSNVLDIPQITSGPVYFTLWDAAGSQYSYVYNFPVDIGITLDKGETESDSLPADTTTTARLTGTTGNGISVLTWKWSENWDSSTSKKIAYKTYWYNTTNVTWELWGYGFESRPITTTSTTRQTGAGTSGYSWNNIKNQNVKFNWTELSPYWTQGGNAEEPYPYNYVYAEVRDADSRLLGSETVPVYVSEEVDKGYFQFYVVTARDPPTIIRDANINLWDFDQGITELNNVNASYGHYLTLVNLSRTYKMNATKAGYAFVGGRTNKVLQEKDTDGNVTYSISSPGTKQIELVMLQVAAGNYTIAFTVEALPADLISDKIKVSNAKITITSAQSTDVIYTDAAGYVEFDAIENLAYTYKVEANTQGCFRAAEGSFYSNAHQWVYVLLDSCTMEPTLTPTPTPTATVTPTPTTTPMPSECISDNAIENMKCLFGVAGAQGNYAGLMLALVICAVLAFVFGYYISFQASLIGAFVGFVFSLAFGLIPIWILIAMIFVGSIFMMGRWWYGAGGG